MRTAAGLHRVSSTVGSSFGMDKNGAPIEWTLLLVSQADAHDVEAHFNLGMRTGILPMPTLQLF